MIKQIVIAIGMMTVTGVAFAGQAQADASTNTALGQGFATLDADGNGQISWSEAKNNIPRSAFKSADGNGDGTLSKSEYRTVGKAGADNQMGSMSGNSMDAMSDDMSSGSGSSY